MFLGYNFCYYSIGLGYIICFVVTNTVCFGNQNIPKNVYFIFVSETYEVLDALFYEDGTTGTPNPNWVKNGGNFDVTPSTDGILISNTFTWAVYYRANLGDTSDTRDYTIPVCVEFDYIEASDNSKWYLQFDDGSDKSIRGDVIQVTNDCHVTIKATSTDTYVKVDNGTERALGYVVASPTGVALRLQGVASLKFKNFKIYPI